MWAFSPFNPSPRICSKGLIFGQGWEEWKNMVLNFIRKSFHPLGYLPAGQQDKSFWQFAVREESKCNLQAQLCSGRFKIRCKSIITREGNVCLERLLEKSCLHKTSLNQTENKVQLKDFHKLIIFVSVPIGLCSDKSICEMFYNKTVLFCSFFLRANAPLLLIAMQFDIMNNKWNSVLILYLSPPGAGYRI